MLFSTSCTGCSSYSPVPTATAARPGPGTCRHQPRRTAVLGLTSLALLPAAAAVCQPWALRPAGQRPVACMQLAVNGSGMRPVPCTSSGDAMSHERSTHAPITACLPAAPPAAGSSPPECRSQRRCCPPGLPQAGGRTENASPCWHPPAPRMQPARTMCRVSTEV
jgi:hypothetical protein